MKISDILTEEYWGKAGAGALIVARSTARILFNHRSENVMEPGTWGTWGGAIDPEETPLEGVEREIREETHFNGNIRLIPLYVFRDGSFSYHNFMGIVDDEFHPDLNWESQGYEWVEFGDWPSPLHFGARKLLSHEDSLAMIEGVVSRFVK